MIVLFYDSLKKNHMHIVLEILSFVICCTSFHVKFLIFYNHTHLNLFVGDCKPSEVKAFTADYLEKVLEPCDWLALWSADLFSVVVEVSLVGFRKVEKLRVAEYMDVRTQSHPKKKCSHVIEISLIFSSVMLGLCVKDVLPKTAD